MSLRIRLLAFVLLLCGIVTGRGYAVEARPTVCLIESAADVPGPPIPLLVRELPRQAMLIAARDGLGLLTRDACLGECYVANPKAKQDSPTLRLNIGFPLGGAAALDLHLLTEGENSKEWLAEQLPFGGDANVQIRTTDILREAEERSRTTFVGALKQAGLEGAPNKIAPAENADVPDGVEELLLDTSFVAAFSAVQQTHELIHASGESPQRLGVLARGYANLSQLVRFHWTLAHEVFAARAMLYAQRMVIAEPASAFAHWNRAYAFALVGLHAAALDDVAEAKKLGKGVLPPRWSVLIEPYCKYDSIELTNLAGKDAALAKQATFLAFLSIVNCGSTVAVMEIGKSTLEMNPVCFRVIDAMTQHAGG